MQAENNTYLIDFFHIDNDPPHKWLRKSLYKTATTENDATDQLQADYKEKIQVMEVTKLEGEKL